MNINFVESNPIPVKAAMALMGLLEPVYRLPLCPPTAGQPGARSQRCWRPWACWGACALQAEIERLFDDKPAAYTRRALSRSSPPSKPR